MADENLLKCMYMALGIVCFELGYPLIRTVVFGLLAWWKNDRTYFDRM